VCVCVEGVREYLRLGANRSATSRSTASHRRSARPYHQPVYKGYGLPLPRKCTSKYNLVQAWPAESGAARRGVLHPYGVGCLAHGRPAAAAIVLPRTCRGAVAAQHILEGVHPNPNDWRGLWCLISFLCRARWMRSRRSSSTTWAGSRNRSRCEAGCEGEFRLRNKTQQREACVLVTPLPASRAARERAAKDDSQERPT